jgi:hypothetical protein
VSSRALLVEITAYVGAALVVASLGLFTAQYWTQLTGAVQVAVLGVVTAVLAASGLVVARLGGSHRELRNGSDEVRRRLASALLSAGATAAGITVGRLVALRVVEDVGNESGPVVAGALTTLVLAVAAYVHAPSVVGQLTMAAAIFMLVTAAWALLDRDEADSWWPGVAFVLIGVLWTGAAETGRFREVVQARAIGGAMALFGSQFTLVSEGHDVLSYLLMLLVSVTAFVMYVRTVAWPYLVVGVLGVTLVVPQAVIDWTGGSLGPSGAVLVAGVTLLGASLVGLRVRKSVADVQEGP